jgi:hypothetical protein
MEVTNHLTFTDPIDRRIYFFDGVRTDAEALFINDGEAVRPSHCPAKHGVGWRSNDFAGKNVTKT